MKRIRIGLALLMMLALLTCGLAAAEEAVSISPATLSNTAPAAGESVTATINAANAYAYNFWLFDERGNIVQEKTNTTDTTWTFAVSAPGIYLLRTYATNFVTEGHADTDWFAVTDSTPAVSVQPATLSGERKTGAALTATMNATNALAYNYWLFDATGTIVQEKTNTMDTTWDFSIAAPGTYLLRAYATNFVTDGWADTEWFDVQTANPVQVGAVTLSTTNFTVGDTLHVEASVSGGTGLYAYNYWVFNDQGAIVMEKTNTLESSADFPLNNVGVYLLRVYATDFSTDGHSDSAWFSVSEPPEESLPADYFTYEISGGAVTITGYVGPADANVIIPSEIEGLPVTAIGERAFYERSDLTGRLSIPGSVTSIGKEAFIRCFYLTGELKLGRNVTYIGEYAFCNCNGLTGHLTIPGGITAIERFAFNDTGITGLTLPEGVTSIGLRGFANSLNLTEVNLPSTLVTIGAEAFDDCEKLKSIVIPDGVVTIDDEAFNRCTGLTGSLVIPDSVETIGDSAFDYCTGLTSLTLGKSVVTIGDGAFWGCNFTGTLTIPDSVETIGETAFLSNSFTALKLGSSVKSIGERAFMGCAFLKGTLTLPISLRTIGVSAFELCSSLTGDLTIPEGVQTIGSRAFAGCRRMTGTLTLPTTVVTIGKDAFGVQGDAYFDTGLSAYLAPAGSFAAEWLEQAGYTFSEY